MMDYPLFKRDEVFAIVDKIFEANKGLTLPQYRTLLRVSCPYERNMNKTDYNYYRRRVQHHIAILFPNQKLRAEKKYDKQNRSKYFQHLDYYRRY